MQLSTRRTGMMVNRTLRPHGHTGTTLHRPRLRDLSEIRGGQVATTTPARPDTPGACRALQAGDLAPDGSVAWAALRWVLPSGSWERSRIEEGDVLVPLRSSRVPALVARGVPPRTICVGHWAIITPGPGLLPDYLVWYLGHPATTRRLAELVVGTKLPFLPLAAVRQLEVEIPPLEVQQRIVAVHTLHRRLTELESQIGHAREQYLNTITRTALDRAVPTPTPSNR